MRGYTSTTAVLMCIGLSLLSPTMCNAGSDEAGSFFTEQQVVELGAAKFVRVKAEVSSAEVKIHGGAEGLLDGRFTYGDAARKPKLRYKVSRNAGDLTLHQPSRNDIIRGDTRNEWDLSFNSSVPLDMNVTSASGSVALDLGELNATRVSVVVASGNTTLDISGDHQQITAVKAVSASGNITTSLNGHYSSLSAIDLTSASGNIALDLSGDWTKNATVRVTTASGNVTVQLPRTVGVRVLAKTRSGRVNAPDLDLVDGVRVNSAYGHSKQTLNVEVESASGDIILSGS